MKWILILALACATWYTAYEFVFKGREGAFGGRFAHKRAVVAPTAPVAEEEPRPLTAAEVLAGYGAPAGGDRGDRYGGGGGGGARSASRSNLPGYVKDRVNSAMQQSERRASGASRY
jgi:hypothetical protein